MEKPLFEKISSKYIFKNIFSYIKVETSLKLLKTCKNIRKILGITLFHYQYYYFFILFKHVKIETLDDILNSPYIQMFPENTKNELICKLIGKRKLFSNIKINNISLPIIQKLIEKKMNNCLIEVEQNELYLYETYLRNNIDKILLNIYFPNNKKIVINKEFQNIKLLNINIQQKNQYIYRTPLNENEKSIIDVTFFNNLEYLSIYTSRIYGEIKLILTQNQYKNIKTLKFNFYPPKIDYKLQYFFNNFKSIKFEADINESQEYKIFFENLRELHINEALLNRIYFKAESLEKLSLFFYNKDEEYIIAINRIINNYPSVTFLNIYLNYTQDFDDNKIYQIIQESLNYLFNSIQTIENVSFYYYDEKKELKIESIPNKHLNYTIKSKNMPFEIFEPYLNKISEIDEIDLFMNNYKKRPLLNIEENCSKSPITKIIRINYRGDNLYISLKSFNTLNAFQLLGNFSSINFPLFHKNSLIKFHKLEYLHLELEELSRFVEFDNLIENFGNIPNLRFLLIINDNICNSNFPYIKIIISKCCILKKLHILIIKPREGEYFNLSNWNKLDRVEQKYSTYPELKNTNIKYCLLKNI